VKPASLAVLFFCLILHTEAWAGLGHPLSDDSLRSGEPNVLLKRIEDADVIRIAAETAGKERIHAVLERLPDGELVLLAENLDKTVSGGFAMTIGEAIGQMLLLTFALGLLIILLFAFGLVALFAGGVAASTSGGAPMGSAQYEEQRKKLEDTKKLKQSDNQQK